MPPCTAGRLAEGLDRWRDVVAMARRAGDPLYVDLATIGVALAMAYGGSVDDALAALADGPAADAPSADAWFDTRGRGRARSRSGDGAPAPGATLAVARSVGDRYLTECAAVLVVAAGSLG